MEVIAQVVIKVGEPLLQRQRSRNIADTRQQSAEWRRNIYLWANVGDLEWQFVVCRGIRDVCLILDPICHALNKIITRHYTEETSIDWYRHPTDHVVLLLAFDNDDNMRPDLAKLRFDPSGKSNRVSFRSKGKVVRGTLWRRMGKWRYSFTSRPLSCRRKNFRCPMTRRVGGRQRQRVGASEKTNFSWVCFSYTPSLNAGRSLTASRVDWETVQSCVA